MNGCTDFEINIQFYVDDELTGAERDEPLSHVKNCPSWSEAMQEAQSFSRRIRAARPTIAAPDSLRTAVLRQMQQAEAARSGPRLVPRRAPDRSLPSLITTVAVLILVAGGVLVNRRQQESQAATVIEAAVAAHQELEQHALPLDIPFDFSQEVSSWFQGRVSFPFRMANSGIAPDATARYKLNGGRLLMVDNEPVALLVFSLPHQLATLIVCPEHLMKASAASCQFR
jgi:anti-sigma factor RsiW